MAHYHLGQPFSGHSSSQGNRTLLSISLITDYVRSVARAAGSQIYVMKLSSIANRSYKGKSYRTKTGNIPVDSAIKLKKSMNNLQYVFKAVPGDVKRIAPALKDVSDTGKEYVEDLIDVNPESI